VISAKNKSNLANLIDHLIDEVVLSHEPMIISGKRHKAVLISEEDWAAIQETLYLASIPEMSESIRNGLNTPIDMCKQKPGW
jgi:PHD/YefM family antitoxin component YafN of YafNO toxin-antitoxin module